MVACFKIRAVPINVNYRYVEEELAYLYNDADLVAVVYDQEFAPRISAVRPRVSTLRHLLAVGTGELLDGAVRYDDAVAAQPATRGFGPRSSEDIFFAGMGGGEPVGTPVERAEEVAERAPKRGQLVMFPVAPLMHGAAQLATWIGFLQAAKVVLVRKFDPGDVLRAVETERANSLSIVGDAMARPLADALAGPYAGTDISSVLAISSAGAILSQSVRERLQELMPKVMLLDNFGASETGFQGTAVAGSSPDAGLRFSVNHRTTVLDESLREVEPGSGVIGRVAQRRHVPLGYYKDPKKTADSFVTIDGERYVLLGDMATVDTDGTIRVLGRGAVCINTGGEKVYPEEVEAALKAHPAVYDVIVTGVPDERYGQRVAAVVELRPDLPAPTTDDLVEHCRTRVAGYKVPRSIVVVDAIRRSPSGKADYPWAAGVARQAAEAVPAAGG
jgi:acyl-CoA synthetase (AMP-forming)/AMP-acid ligase II